MDQTQSQIQTPICLCLSLIAPTTQSPDYVLLRYPSHIDCHIFFLSPNPWISLKYGLFDIPLRLLFYSRSYQIYFPPFSALPFSSCCSRLQHLAFSAASFLVGGSQWEAPGGEWAQEEVHILCICFFPCLNTRAQSPFPGPSAMLTLQ